MEKEIIKKHSETNTCEEIKSSDNEPITSGRRTFMKKLGAAAVTTSTVGLIGASTSTAEASSFNHSGFFGDRGRKLEAKKVRIRAALNQFKVRDANNGSNRDEKTVPGFVANFTKGLPHNDLGEVEASAYRKLKRAIKTGSQARFDRVPLGGVRKLANPQAAFAYSLVGGDSHHFSFPAAPAFSSDWEASEMGEVYLHALLRDVPFNRYDTDPLAAFAVTEINKFSDFRGPKENGAVTPATLFRGETAGDLVGNYVSQLLLLPFKFGANDVEQRYNVTAQGDDHMISYADWLNVQRGGAPTTQNAFDPVKRYIATARDLGEFVHVDFSYQTYLQAALILLGMGTPSNPSNPYSSSITNQGAFITFGGAEILTQVGQVALQALKAAWYQKWNVHRRLRPETFSGRIHNNLTAGTTYPISSEILNSDILDSIFNANGTYLLPMAYPEGSPTHPAYPAGHATIAGACCTVLKAFFDESYVIPNPVMVDPTSQGTALIPYTGTALTVGGELDKLANNISLGRDLAGVHWRTDGTEGILLGEQVAIRMLRDIKLTYSERFSQFSFTGFAGNTITI